METLIQITHLTKSCPAGSPSGSRTISSLCFLPLVKQNPAVCRSPARAKQKEAPPGLSASAVFTLLLHRSVKDLVMQGEGGAREDFSALVPSP